MRRSLALLSLAFACCASQEKRLQVVQAWKTMDYDFPNETAREESIKSGKFIFGNGVPIDVDVYHGAEGTKTFVTIPRFQEGVPVTLGYMTNRRSKEGNPLVAPYPNWQWHEQGNCDSLTSVFRVQVDVCQRLWVLDTGTVNDKRLCPPQILSFSLKTNELLSRYRFPANQYTDVSIYVTPVVDIRYNDCDNVFVYIGDVDGFALLVYDHTNRRSWKIQNKLFYPYPEYGTFDIKGDRFDLMDGILGMALSPLQEDGDRTLYFHSLASKTESRVLTSVIRNDSIFEKDPAAEPRSFKPFLMHRSSQSAAEVMDRKGVLFFGLMSDLAIACWNSERFPQFGPRGIEKVVVDEENLQFASGMKICPRNDTAQELWILTSAFQRFAAGTINHNETNYRILTGSVEQLITGNKCAHVC